jgi:hypothetical protein
MGVAYLEGRLPDYGDITKQLVSQNPNLVARVYVSASVLARPPLPCKPAHCHGSGSHTDSV